eukprot:scaffold3964_cov67-Phaeocystis_antarctica.AAC.2
MPAVPQQAICVWLITPVWVLVGRRVVVRPKIHRHVSQFGGHDEEYIVRNEAFLSFTCARMVRGESIPATATRPRAGSRPPTPGQDGFEGRSCRDGQVAFGHRTDAPDLTKEALRSDGRASPVSKHANRSTEPPVCLASGASTCRPKARVLVRSRPRSPPTSSTATRGASNSRAALSGGAVNSMTSLNPGASAVLDADGHWAKESTARSSRIRPSQAA